MSAPRCPTCKKAIATAVAAADPNARKWAPFCSERCKLVDLQKWLGGSYAIPGRPIDVSDIVVQRDASLDDEH